jgi:hypothetical protein
VSEITFFRYAQNRKIGIQILFWDRYKNVAMIRIIICSNFDRRFNQSEMVKVFTSDDVLMTS